MAGFGQKYHPFTAKPTMVVFGLFLALKFIPQFVPALSMAGILLVPIGMIHSLTVGQALGMLPVNFAMLTLIGELVTFYLVAVALGYVLHKIVGGSSDPF